MLAEFNQEQEEFIKSKGEKEMPTAPWSGYQNEDELKDKILALSEDKRNFLRAPPTGVNFDFEYSAVASHAVVLLEADPRLQKMRYFFKCTKQVFGGLKCICILGMNWSPRR